jgi:hypothetical protein
MATQFRPELSFLFRRELPFAELSEPALPPGGSILGCITQGRHVRSCPGRPALGGAGKGKVSICLKPVLIVTLRPVQKRAGHLTLERDIAGTVGSKIGIVFDFVRFVKLRRFGSAFQGLCRDKWLGAWHRRLSRPELELKLTG